MKANRIIGGAAVAVLMAAGIAFGQRTPSPEVQLKAAIHKETVDGDLKAAMEQYRRLIATPGVSRPVAARAMLQLAGCYEKQGHADARKTYEQLVRQYGDQAEFAAAARTRLAALGRPAAPQALTARRAWSLEYGWNLGPVSLDGRFHAYSGGNKGGLLLRNLATGEVRPVAGVPQTEGVYEAVISPDGKWIAYGGQPDWKLQELRVVGTEVSAAPRTVLRTGKESNVGWVIPLGWTPDNREILVTFIQDSGYNLGMVSVETGKLRVLREFDFGFYRWASLSPDGKWVAYSVQPSPDRIECDINVMRTDGATDLVLIGDPADDIDPVWTADGRGVVFRSNRRGSVDAWFVPVREGHAQDDPVMIKADVRGELRGVTRQGTLYYEASAGTMDIYRAGIDAETGLLGSAEKLPLANRGDKRSAVLSPDGSLLAYIRPSAGVPRVSVVVLRSMSTGEEREIVPPAKDLRHLTWYPDGKSLALAARNMKDEHCIWKTEVASGKTVLLFPFFELNGASMGFSAPSVGPDGRTLYPVTWGDKWVLFALDSVTRQFREILQANALSPRPVVSPDGRFVATGLRESGGRGRLGVVDTQSGQWRALAERGGHVAGWSSDSRYVIATVRAGADQSELWRIPLDGGETRKSPFPSGDHVDRMPRATGDHVVWISGRLTPEIWAVDHCLPRP